MGLIDKLLGGEDQEKKQLIDSNHKLVTVHYAIMSDHVAEVKRLRAEVEKIKEYLTAKEKEVKHGKK